MFKGIKKRFSTNRSGRNRRLVSGGREQGEASPREPPDRGGSKPTSPRQVHPVDQISPVPYARRSLERRSRTVPSGKHSPAAPPSGYDRRTDSFCLSPNKDLYPCTAPPAYPTAPNICVTAGKIEFITLPGSTLSSNASGNCFTLFSSPSLSPSPSPKGETPQRLRSTLPVNKGHDSPSSRNSSRKRSSPRRATPAATPHSTESPKTPSSHPLPSVPISNFGRDPDKVFSADILPPKSHSEDNFQVKEQTEAEKSRISRTMPIRNEAEEELDHLREENTQVKQQLESLKQEFFKLQEYVKELEKKAASTPTKDHQEEDKLSQFQVLMERCNTLEQVNAQLQADSQLQRQQYEKCLDKVASQVVQAILVQKTQQEQCERLSKKVEDLQKQNLTLTSFIASKGRFQSLNHRRKPHFLPVSLALTYSNSQSLPNTLIKAKADCDKNKATDAPTASWYNNKESNSTSHLSSPVEAARIHSNFANSILPSDGSSSLPQSGSSRKRSLRHQSSADACWYDIIKSHKKGESVQLNVPPHNLSDNHTLSSDSSSVETEEQISDSRRGTLPNTEDTNSSSCSSGDDFHAMSFPTSHNQHQPQGEITSRLPSSTASDPESRHPNSNCSLVSSQCPHPKNASTTAKGRTPDITLEFLPQTTDPLPPSHQNVVVNFSLINDIAQVSSNATGMSPPPPPPPPPPPTSTSVTLQQLTNSVVRSNTSLPVDPLSGGKTPRSSPEAETKLGKNESETKSGDVIVKDEGYSTMSSDVQSEAKESVAVVTISTVEEEKGKSFDGENEARETSPASGGTISKSDLVSSLKTLEVEKSNNIKNLSLGVAAPISIKDSSGTQPEYCDGLRVIYDDDDDNSDIFFVPISDGEKYLRHSFNFPFPEEPIHLQRCSSDSYLYKLFIRFPSTSQNSKKLRTNQNTLLSLPLNKQYQSSNYNAYLRRAFRKESLKRGCWKLFNRPPTQGSGNNESLKMSGGANYDFLSQVFPPFISHPRILSPSYSHAEMEDWSLDLSGEDITTPGGTEPSAAESSAPSHHLSQPSIQEATLELEEDHHDFLWNGATYFKADDNELSWPYDKDPSRTWDLNLDDNKQCRSMISPKSGCSDQPAMWSSSEQLSCCSDIASKCSTDIENFCEQLCNLPELKRISVCSSENEGNDSVPSNPKLSEIDSNEDNSELIEDLNVETVFTRDFYRLVKFESTKSLTASSKSLATSEGFLTLEKLKGLESLQNKTLASVLGFIAEQQKYCNDREVMDESASFGPLNSKTEDKEQDAEAYFQMQISEDSQSNNEMENIPERGRSTDDNVLTSSESLSCLNLETELRSSSHSRPSTDGPPKPKRSTSLNLGMRGGRSYRSRGTLPPLPSSHSPPPLPSRSTSRSTLPHRQLRAPASEIPEEPFPPPPPIDDPYVEPYHAIPAAPPPPVVPPHRIPFPSLPQRSSSIARNSSILSAHARTSPPVPKRITSRALPEPPPVNIPNRTSSLDGAHLNDHQQQKQAQTPTRFNRPRSLLREATVSNAINKSQGRQRGSCGDLGPLCRNSATLMLELQKMAKAEEEEEKDSSFHSPEATSPGTEVGLGTGWVRVEPVSDLGDPQTRANLLDAMMPSSEGCSSETDEDLAKQLQHTELLKAVQRNRRKRKASRHSGSDPLRVVGWGHHLQRPTILGRPSLFNRYGEEEERALMEFQFLESFPSQSDIMMGGDPQIQPRGALTYHPPCEREDVPPSPQTPPSSCPRLAHCSNPYVRPTTELKDLRSSEPCQDIQNYPLSVPRLDERGLSSYLSLSSSSDLMEDARAYPCQKRLQSSGCHLYPDFNRSYNSQWSWNYCNPGGERRADDCFPSFRKHSCVRKFEASDDNKLPNPDVPSEREVWPGRNCCKDLREKDVFLDGRQSHFEKVLPDNTEMICDHEKINSYKLSGSKIPLKNEQLSNLRNGDTNPALQQRENSEERELVDTRSLTNVKATIQKLNSRSQNSGKLFKGISGTKLNSSGSYLHTISGQVSKISSSPFSSTKNRLSEASLPPPPDPSVEKSSRHTPVPRPTELVTSSRNLPLMTPASSSSSSKRTPKLPGSNLIKRLTAQSAHCKEIFVSLPPKGSNSSPRIKERNNALAATSTQHSSSSRLLPPKSGASAKGGMMRSPRLPRFKLGRTRPDPLETFNGKNLCDSGSSECSDKGFGGRLSISDSCAEIFSPNESGDEVFHRIP